MATQHRPAADHINFSGGKLASGLVTLFDIYIVIHGYIRLVDQNTSLLHTYVMQRYMSFAFVR